MKAATVMSVRDQAIARVSERSSITVTCGEMFVKNLWREFDLPHINKNALTESVDAMCKEGLLAVYEASASKSEEESAGVVRNRTTSRERTYTLTEAGRRHYQRIVDNRTDMP